MLNVQDALAINFTLPVGAVSETITVEGGAPLINTQDATVSTVVDRQFAENLPLNGRSFQTLIQLTPGVVLTATNVVDSGQFSVNGQRASSNYWMVDGVSANIGIGTNTAGNGMGGSLGAFSALGGTNSLVSVDAMQEFRIQTSTYAPEFGRTPGGQISIVTRSGTNQFHGTAFDYLRNDLFDANDWFSADAGLKKPQERQNDFGGTFSGPLLRNRTFFFFSYEGLRLRLPQVEETTVPCDSTCTVAGNARAEAVATMQPYLNAFPLPNGPEILARCDPASDPNCPSSGEMATGAAQLNASFSNAATLDAYSVRIDHRLNGKVALFGRYNNSPSEIIQRGGGSLALSLVTPIHINTQTGTAGATWILSTDLANDFRFNYSRTKASDHGYMDGFGGSVPLSSLPFPSPFTSGNGVLLVEIFSLKSPQLLVGPTANNLQRQFNIVDNLSAQRGSHSLKFGVDFRRLSPVTHPEQYIQGAIFRDLNSAETGKTLFGEVASFSRTNLLFRNLGVFAQDTWRVAPRLTLTYGLRWDLDFAPTSLSGPNIPALTGYSLTDFSHLAIAPAGTPPFKTTYGNVAPRIGLAYEVSKKQDWQTVFRGGLGIFYDLANSQTGSLVSSVPPFGKISSFFGKSFPYDSESAAAPVIPTTPTLSQLFEFNPDLKLPYTVEWNVALEQALGGQQSISASYIGSAGRRLLQTTFLEFPPSNPNIQGATLVDNTATSDYESLQIQFHRRLSNGLQALASYVWAHSIDTASAGSAQLSSNAGLGSNSQSNRGPSDFDIRHSFSTGLTYDLPALKRNRLANTLLRQWSVETIIQVHSAPPVDISDGNFFSPFSSGIAADIRPDVVNGQPYYLYGTQCASIYQALGELSPGHSCPGGQGINPAAFTDPPSDPNTGAPLRQGTLRRNALRGFGSTQWDFAVHREFPIHESLKLQFRAEMFNILNHPNFGPPLNQFGQSGFGLAQQTLAQSLAGAGSLGGGGFDPLYQVGGPRSMQFALKLIF